MAVPKVSKMVTDRQRRYEVVVELVRTHREELAEALGLSFQNALDPSGSGIPDYLDLLMARLRRTFDELVEAETRHLDELANDAVLRKRRDGLATALRQALFAMRQVIRGAFGGDIAQVLGFERRIADDPRPLIRQGRRIEDKLRDVAVVLPPSRVPGISVDREPMAAALGALIEELREAVDHVTRDASKAQGTKVTKDLAMKAFDKTYPQVAQSLAGVFRLAGRTELAARIPRVRRRPSKSKNP